MNMTCPHCEYPEKKITICDDCPCMSHDNYGTYCNLGYGYIGGELSLRSFCDNKLHYWTDKCQLIKIITEDEEFVPEVYGE
jgi:hypothetical protein